MKTTNNVQKAGTKSMAVIISLVLISLTVNAQDFWKTVMRNNSFSQIAMALADNSKPSTSPENTKYVTHSDAYTKYSVVDTEKALNVENWMLNENNFFTTLAVENEADDEMKVENWMTNETLFNGTAAYIVESEEALELEDWMTESNYFGVQSITIEAETEEALEFEAWMTDNKVWKI